MKTAVVKTKTSEEKNMMKENNKGRNEGIERKGQTGTKKTNRSLEKRSCGRRKMKIGRRSIRR